MFDDRIDRAPRLSIQPSVAVELDWAMSAAHPAVRAGSELLPDFYAARPELAERVRSLWPAEDELSYPGYPELSIVAHRAGLLFGLDAAGLLDRLEDPGYDLPDTGGLEAETPDDRDRIRRRLDKLRSSRATRRRYDQVVRDLWAELGPLWESAGRPAVESAVEARRAALLVDPSWESATVCTPDHQDQLRSLVGGLAPDGEIVVVPAFFTRKGLIIDLPGLVLVGVRAEPVEATSRQRAEALARRLKAISEPTRLAVVETLVRRAMTVSELATLFSLAQPTVSNHVKVLRDAGLVVPGGDPRHRDLVVRREAVADLLAELERFIAGPDGRGPDQAR